MRLVTYLNEAGEARSGVVSGERIIDLAQGAAAVAIGGGLGFRLKDHLPRSGFRDRFIAKGRFERRMDALPPAWDLGSRRLPHGAPTRGRDTMTGDIRQTVISGRPYPVTVPPAGDADSLDLFLDDAEFSIDLGRGPLLVRGHGTRLGEVVRFHEKDEVLGRDVRVWCVSELDGGFVAEHMAAF